MVAALTAPVAVVLAETGRHSAMQVVVAVLAMRLPLAVMAAMALFPAEPEVEVEAQAMATTPALAATVRVDG